MTQVSKIQANAMVSNPLRVICLVALRVWTHLKYKKDEKETAIKLKASRMYRS